MGKGGRAGMDAPCAADLFGGDHETDAQKHAAAWQAAVSLFARCTGESV